MDCGYSAFGLLNAIDVLLAEWGSMNVDGKVNGVMRSRIIPCTVIDGVVM